VSYIYLALISVSLKILIRTQVMRKKAEVSPISTSTGIAKKITAKVSRVTAKSTHKKDVSPSVNIKQIDCPASPPSHGMVTCEDDDNNGGSRGRSTTPSESDLLRYLTAHITPHTHISHNTPHPETGDTDNLFGGELTSFTIGREEYLEGIVRLVKSDCPEVVQDMGGFLKAMKQAFTDVNVNIHQI
jgi:hypothetical protein